MGERITVGFVAALCGAAFALTAAPAGAAVTELGRGPISSPRLAGDGVVFLSGSTVPVTRVMQVRAGQAATELPAYRPTGKSGKLTESVGVAASATQVAVSQFSERLVKGVPTEPSFLLSAGPFAGPPQRSHDCARDLPFDVDGDRLAYVADSCTEGGGDPNENRLVVRDLAVAGAPMVASVALGGPDTTQRLVLDLAGARVAFDRRAAGGGTEVVVHNLDTDSVEYAVPGVVANSVSLQPNGTMALGYGQDHVEHCHIDWFSVADPTAHRIEVCPRRPVRMAGDRIAYVHGNDGAGSIELRALSGATRIVAQTGSVGMVQYLDFDGSRVAYVLDGCRNGVDQLEADDLADAAFPTVSSNCPVEISRSAVRASSSGLVRFTVDCAIGCSGELDVRRGGRSLLKAPGTVRIGSGDRRVAARLSRGARDTLGDDGSLTVTVTVRRDVRGGLRTKTEKQAVRLLAPK